MDVKANQTPGYITKTQTALVLSGGGARGAYQAGVIRAIAEITQEMQVPYPFSIATGVSAGALNAVYLSAMAHEFPAAAEKLAHFWAGLTSEQVFRTDIPSIGRIALLWGRDLLLGGLRQRPRARALLDTSPLYELLQKNIDFAHIEKNIEAGVIRALEVTATDYATSESVSFIQARDTTLNWKRARRRSIHVKMGLEHIMASSALPLFFPPVSVDGHYYGDGALRNLAPLSSALRLGAKKILVIGVKKNAGPSPDFHIGPSVKPTIARVVSVMLNGIFFDSVEMDLERMQRVNETLQAIPPEVLKTFPMQPIEYLNIRPSEDIGAFAASKFGKLPPSLRYLISGLGSKTEASELVSYLLFEPEFVGYLVDLGYRDGIAKKELIKKFLEP